MSTWSQMEAERAFTVVARARRRAALVCRLRGRAVCTTLAVYEELPQRRTGGGVREIPVDAISGTVEPNRAAQFDPHFRPSATTRGRWQSVWLAIHRGVTLPPISVVRVADGYAIRDGHHRVSVAKALGTPTIPAVVAA
jgi:ParB-like nuclease domain